MKFPWTPDYETSPQQLWHVFEHNTSLSIKDVRYLSEGWDFYSYLVNDVWVFRLPKRNQEADTLNRERQLLQKLEIPVRHPQFEIWVPKPVGFHLPFAAYRFIPGTPLSELDPSDVNLTKLATDLGACLRQLHSSLITKPRPSRDPVKPWLDEIEDVLANCQKYLAPHVMEVCSRMIASYELQRFADSMVSCHCDLGPEHILVDENRELTAIIDWADMGTAPRFTDFAGSWLWGGERYFRDLCTAYGVQPNPRECNMVRMLGVLLGLAAIDFGHLEKDQDAIDYGVHSLVSRVEQDLRIWTHPLRAESSVF